MKDLNSENSMEESVNYDYWLWPQALPKWFCDEQIRSIDWKQSQEGVVRNYDDIGSVDSKTRITDVVWLDEASPIGCIAQIYINIANKKAGWNLNLCSCEQIQIGKYDGNVKGFYDWHTDDSFKVHKNGLIRKLSISVLLNDPKEYEGGLLEFKEFSDSEQPKLQQGSIIVFKSYLEHRVSPVTSGTRYSAVTWVSGPAYR